MAQINTLRPRLIRVLGLGLALAVSGILAAGEVVIPGDVSVSLTAEPSTDLRPGQLIAFTISVTNHGPQPVTRMVLGSSPIYDELNVFSGGSSDCDNHLVLGVSDFGDYFYYTYDWFVAGLPGESPLAVGETRTCYLTLPYTQYAPAEFPVTFDHSAFVDPDPSNDSATVILRRAVTPAAAIPTLSPPMLALLALLLAAAVGISRQRGRRLPNFTSPCNDRR